MNTEYYIKKGTASDEELEKYKKCFENNGSPKLLKLLKWQHQENLPGKHSILFAIDNTTHEIAAIYTYLPVVFRCLGEEVNVMQSFDTLTDKGHRGKGLFIKLAKQIEEEQRKGGTAFIYGFPNENSTPGFLKKLYFHSFGEVPFLIKPLKVSFFFKRIFKRFLKRPEIISDRSIELKISPEIISKFGLTQIEKFGQEYDQFYGLFKDEIIIGLDRGSNYMNWRYVTKPNESYARFALFDNDKLKGVVVFTLKSKHGGKIGYIMDLLFDRKDTISGKVLLQFATRILKVNGADLILTWCYKHSFNYSTYKKLGFYKFPERLRPQKLGFIVKVLNSQKSNEIYKLNNWYLSYSDSDTV